ncbi:molybdopterin molybdotransferase MoeA [Acinetobacter sp. ANC 3832]|uniref:molybdopterin molybdotransferase MoeA n=1 Tax=Acinetobacter sp. ANC 3832 TaxID=1977874 RepID=UPI000A348838|nr:molybdopterin molybdotransferase MoeA [Acinetobacter sp. ANC 3832]OTG93869.1 molybdopterin molybdenumtransferase MoeA [Acinetobacter sp. ANC 3832]
MSESINEIISFQAESATQSGCGTESGLISIDQALALILEKIQPLGTETLSLNAALNRYLAEDIFSTIQLPLFSQSAVDGYAINSADPVENHLEEVIQAHSQFTLIGEIRAGQSAELTLQAGQALRIFTGAEIPQGTTTVARQEIVQIVNAESIEITEHLKIHADIRDAGEEITVGQLLAQAGQQLSVGAIASLSMAGVQQVQVYQYPKIAVVITGDEVAKSSAEFEAGKIFDANAPLIQAWFQQQNQTVDIFHVADTAEAVNSLLADLNQKYDLILSTGGVSVGDYDFIRPVALDLGFQQIFWKVKQKPGKPMLFAEFIRTDGSVCYLLGLPGNPAAVYVGMHIYTQTILNALQGHRHIPNGFKAALTHDLKADVRERILRMTVSFAQATLKVSSLSNQQSHMLNNLMHANALVRIPAGEKIHAGQIVDGFFI